MATRYNAPTILAMYFCWSLSDLREARYQNGRTTGPVYAIGEDYWCCIKKGGKLPQPTDHAEKWKWERVADWERVSRMADDHYEIYKATA